MFDFDLIKHFSEMLCSLTPKEAKDEKEKVKEQKDSSDSDSDDADMKEEKEEIKTDLKESSDTKL